MNRPFARIAATTAVLSCLAVAAGGTALAGARAPAAHPAATAAATSATGRQVLTLPGAGRVLVGRESDGPGSVSLPGRSAGGLIALRLGGQDYAIPRRALPDLGRGLDLSLFNVGALERVEHGGRVPVTVSYRGRPGAVPGVTLTGPGTGYLTAGSAARLAGRDGVSVGLASSTAPGSAAARPGAGARTVHVTVRGTGLNGKPTSDGLVLLGDVANSNARGTGLKPLSNGTARFSGPRGDYWALAMFFPPREGPRAWLRIDVLPQFKVAGNTTVRLSAPAATSRVTLTSPRPARTGSLGMTVVRTAPHAPASALSSKVDSLMVTNEGPVYVSPVSRQPLYGGLRAFTFGQLLSPAGARVPYAYTLDYANPPGTIAPQHFAATPASLATVSERYYQDRPSAGAWLTLGGTPWQLNRAFFGGFYIPLRLPGRQVQYLSGGTPTEWQSSYYAYRVIRKGMAPGGQNDTARLIRGGQHLTEVWGEYPLHPAPEVNVPGNTFAVYPSAVRQGNELSLDLTPFSDNQPSHAGDGYDIPFPDKHNQMTGAYGLFQNGRLIAHGNAVKAQGLVSARLSRRPSTMMFLLSASRASAQYRLSATSVDEWTWHTRREPGPRIPAPWVCPGQGQHCAVQPLITFDYAVAGMGLDGIVPAGPQAITVTARHLQLAAAPAITTAQAQISLNGGQSWRRARVRDLGRGRFKVTFTAPRGAGVTLRVTARDTAGNSLTEIIQRAYQTSA